MYCRFVKPGDKVAQFDQICEVQSDKASVTISSRYDGVVKTLRYKVEETVLVGEPFIDIQVADDDPAEVAADPLPGSPKVESERAEPARVESEAEYETNKALATPAVRKIAKENQVDLSRVPATGKAGRVLKEDILAYLAEPRLKAEPANADAILCDRTVDAVSASSPKKYAKHMWKTMTRSLVCEHTEHIDFYLPSFSHKVIQQLRFQKNVLKKMRLMFFENHSCIAIFPFEL